ncbi:MAG: xanthine dehydrogenase family protein subunit M, partial [Smithella sp.]
LESEFDYLKPDGLGAALDLLAEKKNVKILAGGTDLIVKMKMDAVPNIDFIMDINGIPELKKIETDPEKALVIGATAKMSHVEKDNRVIETYEALKEALYLVASISIRNMATIGGNFCNASPVADSVGPVICYKGSVQLASKKGIRNIPAEDFFVAPGISVKNEDELLTTILLPEPKKDTGAAFIKFGRVKSDIAKISLTVVLERSDETILSCRLAMGSVAATPLYLKDISEELTGKVMTEALIEETAQRISMFIKPINDIRSTAEYRTDMAKIIAEDALKKAWERSGGKLK